MSERTVKVRCEELCKRMHLTLQTFDVFKETIRTRLNLETEEMSIKAILDGDEEEYDITADGDLKDLWQGLKELRIIPNQFERLKRKTVEINRVQYRLDGPMAADSPIVKGYIEEYDLREFTTQSEALTSAMGHLCTATISIGNKKLINGMIDICFSTRQVCGKTRILMSEYEQTCSHVIEAIQRMIFYINANNGKPAFTSYTKIGELVRRSCEDTRKLIDDIDKTLERMKVFASEIADVQYKTDVKLQGIQDNMKNCKDERMRAEKEETEIEKAMVENQKRAGECEKQVAEVDKRKSDADKVAKGAGIGLAASVVTGPLFVIAGPICALVAIGGGIGVGVHKNKKASVEKELQKNREQVQMKSSEIINLEQKREELDAVLKELSLEIEQAKNLSQASQDARKHIRCMQIVLQNQLESWEALKLICVSLERNQEMEEHLKEVNCSKILEARPFREQVVRYYARWVALKAFARRCNESLTAETKKLEDCTRADMSREEAREHQQAIKGRDVLYLMAPE